MQTSEAQPSSNRNDHMSQVNRVCLLPMLFLLLLLRRFKYEFALVHIFFCCFVRSVLEFFFFVLLIERSLNISLSEWMYLCDELCALNVSCRHFSLNKTYLFLTFRCHFFLCSSTSPSHNNYQRHVTLECYMKIMLFENLVHLFTLIAPKNIFRVWQLPEEVHIFSFALSHALSPFQCIYVCVCRTCGKDILSYKSFSWFQLLIVDLLLAFSHSFQFDSFLSGFIVRQPFESCSNHQNIKHSTS